MAFNILHYKMFLAWFQEEFLPLETILQGLKDFTIFWTKNLLKLIFFAIIPLKKVNGKRLAQGERNFRGCSSLTLTWLFRSSISRRLFKNFFKTKKEGDIIYKAEKVRKNKIIVMFIESGKFKDLEKIIENEVPFLTKEAYRYGVSSELKLEEVKSCVEKETHWEIEPIKIIEKVIRSMEPIHIDTSALKESQRECFSLLISPEGILRILHESVNGIFFYIHLLIEELPLHFYPSIKKLSVKNGIYFFYERGEKLKVPTYCGERIVRVGTHREDGHLLNRLHYHFEGNKKNSVFRELIGEALISKESVLTEDMEEKVSEILKKNFAFRFIEVEDKEWRLYLEKRLISTLSFLSPDYVSEHWLGRYSKKSKVRECGMWNQQYVDDEGRFETLKEIGDELGKFIAFEQIKKQKEFLERERINCRTCKKENRIRQRYCIRCGSFL